MKAVAYLRVSKEEGEERDWPSPQRLAIERHPRSSASAERAIRADFGRVPLSEALA